MLEVRGITVPAGADVRALVQGHALTGGPAYVRFERAGADLPLDDVAKLARRCEPWVDAAPADVADALDLAVAGAGGIVVWMGAMAPSELEEVGHAMGEQFLLACTDLDLPAAAALALELGCPLIIDGASGPPGDEPGWRLSRPSPGQFLLTPIGSWPDPAAPDATAPGPEMTRMDAQGVPSHGVAHGEPSPGVARKET